MNKIDFITCKNNAPIPYIRINEGEYKDINLMADTGCVRSVLNKLAAEQHKDRLQIDENNKFDHIAFAGSEPIKMPKYYTNMVIAGRDMKVFVNINNNEALQKVMSGVAGFTAHGILGMEDIANVGLSIDFRNNCFWADSIDDESNIVKVRFTKNLKDTLTPFVTVSSGDLAGLNLMVDTGANCNVLFKHAFETKKDHLTLIEDENAGIVGANDELHKGYYTDCSFAIANRDFTDRFTVIESPIQDSMNNQLGFSMDGIIGNKFMKNYGWVINTKDEWVGW